MPNQEFHLRFENCSVADANVRAEDLRQDLLDAVEDVDVSLRRDDPTSQDFGATLVLVLGTPAVIALSRAIGKWLVRTNQASVTILTKDGRVVAQNIDSADAAKMVESALTKELKS
jgi:hypothetical protein